MADRIICNRIYWTDKLIALQNDMSPMPFTEAYINRLKGSYIKKSFTDIVARYSQLQDVVDSYGTQLTLIE